MNGDRPDQSLFALEQRKVVDVALMQFAEDCQAFVTGERDFVQPGALCTIRWGCICVWANDVASFVSVEACAVSVTSLL